MLLQQDILGGVLLAAFGVLGLVFGASLDMGSTRRMGPGYFPKVLSWLLIVLGGLIAAFSVKGSREAVTGIVWRPVALITVATAVFGVLMDRAGLILATAGVIILSAFAGRDARLIEVGVLAVTMAVLAAGLFVYLLGLPLPLWIQ
jgi:hypothetical protein